MHLFQQLYYPSTTPKHVQKDVIQGLIECSEVFKILYTQILFRCIVIKVKVNSTLGFFRSTCHDAAQDVFLLKDEIISIDVFENEMNKEKNLSEVTLLGVFCP